MTEAKSLGREPLFQADVCCAHCRGQEPDLIKLVSVRHSAVIEGMPPTLEVALVHHRGRGAAGRATGMTGKWNPRPAPPDTVAWGRWAQQPWNLADDSMRSLFFKSLRGLAPRSRCDFVEIPRPPLDEVIVVKCRSCYRERNFRLAVVLRQVRRELETRSQESFALLTVYI